MSARGLALDDTFPPRVLGRLDGPEMPVPAADKVTVVVFWATWSPRSLEVLRFWEQLGSTMEGVPFTVAAVNAEHQEISEQDVRDIKAYLQSNGISLPVVLDHGLVLFNEIGVMALPTSVYLSSEGRILYRLPGFPAWAPEALRDELKARLGIVSPEPVVAKPDAGPLPANNADLFYNLAMNLRKKGFPVKARDRLRTSLQRDPSFEKALTALEEDFFFEGRTPEAETLLADFLAQGGLEDLAARYRKKP